MPRFVGKFDIAYIQRPNISLMALPVAPLRKKTFLAPTNPNLVFFSIQGRAEELTLPSNHHFHCWVDRYQRCKMWLCQNDCMTHVHSFWFCASWAEAAARNVAQLKNWALFKTTPKKYRGKAILHISAIMSFELNGSASWVTGKCCALLFVLSSSFFQIGLNYWIQGPFILAAVSSSCCMYWKLQTHVHPKHETKALQNVGNKKSWKANSGSSSTTALLAAASIELKLYRVWYTRFYLAFTGWLIQYAAKQGRISSVIEKYELKGRPSRIVCVTAQCNQLYPCHISCHIITYSANAHIHKEILSVTKMPIFMNAQEYWMSVEETKLVITQIYCQHWMCKTQGQNTSCWPVSWCYCSASDMAMAFSNSY